MFTNSTTNLSVANSALHDQLMKYKKIIFHSGSFHADEIFATAYLMILYDFFGLTFPKWERKNVISPEMTEENGYLVYDIGGGRFDHHFPEEEKERREDGTPYAAFGLIVKAFHEGFLNEDEYQDFDNSVIKGLDFNDNTGCGNPLALVIKDMNPTWDSPDSNIDMRVGNAISLAKSILENRLENIRSDYKAKEIADTAVDVADNTVYLERYAPIGRYIAPKDGLAFFGVPSNREYGKYSIIGVKWKGVNKELFPKQFRGLSSRTPNFAQINFDTGLSFVHPNGFMATFDNKELAKKFMREYKGQFEHPPIPEDDKEKEVQD